MKILRLSRSWDFFQVTNLSSVSWKRVTDGISYVHQASEIGMYENDTDYSCIHTQPALFRYFEFCEHNVGLKIHVIACYAHHEIRDN